MSQSRDKAELLALAADYKSVAQNAPLTELRVWARARSLMLQDIAELSSEERKKQWLLWHRSNDYAVSAQTPPSHPTLLPDLTEHIEVQDGHKIVLRGELGVGPTVAQILDSISKSESIEVEIIGGYGGDACFGLELYERLKPLKPIITVHDACYSAHTLVLMAGKERRIKRGGMIMVHSTRGAVCGTPAQLRERAESLERSNEKHMAIMREVTGLPDEEIRLWQSGADHWFDSQEALDLGLVTKII